MLLGPTGAGKTTTLRLIAGLETPDAGTVSIGGEDTAGWSVAQRDVALVFQYYSLYPRYTVRQNLAFPLQVAGAQLRAGRDRAARSRGRRRCCASSTCSTARPTGSRAARCSASRSAAPSCATRSVFLMDEPLSNLDAKLREALRSELKNLQTTLGATFLFVTHDQIEAMSMGDRIGVLNEGRLVQVGTPERDLQRPARHLRRDLRRLAGDEPAAEACVEDGRARGARAPVEVPLGPPAGRGSRRDAGPLTLGIRSEDIARRRRRGDGRGCTTSRTTASSRS